MSSLYTIRPLDPRSGVELDTVTCFSVMTIWESRPELRRNPADTPGYTWAETHMHLKAALKSDNARLIVAVDGDGMLVGSSISAVRTNDEGQAFGYFWSRYTLPRMRRQGMATRFLADSESWFRSRGCTFAEVHIHAENQGLRALFMSRGYAVSTRGNDNLWSWIVLRKDL